LHQQYAFNLAFRIILNEDDAKDIVQESFIKIWKNLNIYDLKVKFTTWMYKIVTNTAIDRIRKMKKVGIVSLENLQEKVDDIIYSNPEASLTNKQLVQMISFLGDKLPEKQRLVFLLRDMQGLESAEVEHILELSETSVKSNLYHARRSIRQKLIKILNYERREI
jgi:RNA polymerase sigma-70 factor (ECF subfamily)